jgi:hypothetical protein
MASQTLKLTRILDITALDAINQELTRATFRNTTATVLRLLGSGDTYSAWHYDNISIALADFRRPLSERYPTVSALHKPVEDPLFTGPGFNFDELRSGIVTYGDWIRDALTFAWLGRVCPIKKVIIHIYYRRVCKHAFKEILKAVDALQIKTVEFVHGRNYTYDDRPPDRLEQLPLMLGHLLSLCHSTFYFVEHIQIPAFSERMFASPVTYPLHWFGFAMPAPSRSDRITVSSYEGVIGVITWYSAIQHKLKNFTFVAEHMELMGYVEGIDARFKFYENEVSFAVKNLHYYIVDGFPSDATKYDSTSLINTLACIPDDTLERIHVIEYVQTGIPSNLEPFKAAVEQRFITDDAIQKIKIDAAEDFSFIPKHAEDKGLDRITQVLEQLLLFSDDEDPDDQAPWGI